MIPENILRAHFGGHCFAARLGDTSPREAFARTGVGKAGALPVFCAEHDNKLFSAIDLLQPAHLGSPRHQFLLSFRAIAFALRKVQILLGIDLQIELFRPFLINEKIQKSSEKHVEIDISHLHTHIMTFAAEKPLLADDHPISPEDLQLIARQKARAARCLKLDSDEVFKLADPTHSVRFVNGV